jgi:hypothetical protein
MEAGSLAASLPRLVARRPACVIFDLSELTVLSSFAVGVLATYCRAAVRDGTRVYLRPNLDPLARQALNHFELLDLFEAVARAGPTWDQLVALEPRLETLLLRARVAAVTCRCSPSAT